MFIAGQPTSKRRRAAMQAALYTARKNRVARVEAESVSGPDGGTTTWNASDKTGITLSADLLTATASSFAFNGIRATNPEAAASTRKVYFEFTTNTLVDNRGFLGVIQTSDSLGGASGFLSVNEAGSAVSVEGGSHVVSFGTLGGKNIGFAIDFAAKKVWVRANGGDWNSDPTADPAAGTGGFAWATSHQIAIGCTIIDNGGTVVLNCGQAVFAYSKPSGFVAWG